MKANIETVCTDETAKQKQLIQLIMKSCLQEIDPVVEDTVNEPVPLG